MGEKRNYAALQWVVGEIDETLQEARQALEAFVDDPRDVSRLRFCLTHVHQVHGSLQMVQFHGAALIAEEMELLVQAMLQDAVTSLAEAQEVFMRALLQLPIYLDHVQNFQDDHPGVALPLLNDIRAVRKQAYLSETGLFSPDLTKAHALEGDRHSILQDRGKLVQALKKLREMYQYAAASLLKDVRIDENLEYIDKVFSRIEIMSRGTRVFGLWQAASGLAEGLRADEIELCAAVRSIVRRLARELKVLEENAPSAFDAPPKDGLLKNILYYVARVEHPGPRALQLRQKYQLENALNDGATTGRDFHKTMISAPDPEAIRSVLSALQDEINTVKHILGLALSGQANASDVEEILPLVKRVADTLAVLGIPDLRKFAQDQYDQLTHLCSRSDWDAEQFAGVAERIVQIEHRLEAVLRNVGRTRDLNSVDERQTEIDLAKETVTHECRVGLEQCKDAIVEFCAANWERAHLDAVPGLMADIRGGLGMIPQPRAAAIIAACQAFIQEQLLSPEWMPDGAALTALANAIEGVDYFLERVSAAHTEAEVTSFLELAEDSLRKLNYPAAGREIAPASVGSDVVATPTTEAVVPATEAVITAEPASPAVAPQPALEAQSMTQATPAVKQAVPEESLIDDEIIEIFIEEAAEVQDTLEEYFPQWVADTSNTEALITVRRAFHTLKGSGRMVAASEVGELAWSVENMINRFLDRSVTANRVQIEYIQQVMAFMPSLLQAFAGQTANPNPALTEQLTALGHAFSRGEIPVDALDVPVEHGVSATATTDTPDIDDEERILWELFAGEALTHLEVVDAFIAHMEDIAPLYAPPSDDLQRALHTLKGSAHMANFTPIANLATPLEGFIKELRAYQMPVNADILQLLKDGAAYTHDAVEAIRAGKLVELPHNPQFIARANELKELYLGHLIRSKEQVLPDGHKQVDPRLLSIFMAEEMRLLLDADQILLRWQHNPMEHSGIPPLIAELECLETGAIQANLPEMAKLSAELSHLHELALVQATGPDTHFFSLLMPAHEHLLDMVDSVAAGQNLPPVSETLQQGLQDLAAQLRSRLIPTGAEPEEDLADESLELQDLVAAETFAMEDAHQPPIVPLLDEPVALLDDEPVAVNSLGELLARNDEVQLGNLDLGEGHSAALNLDGDEDDVLLAHRVAAQVQAATDVASSAPVGTAKPSVLLFDAPPPLVTNADTVVEDDDFDPEILEIFLEEADELMEEMDEAVHKWESNIEHPTAADVMKRALHTLKGGARLAGQTELGELTHNYETYLNNQAGPSGDPLFFPTILRYQDQLLRAIRKSRALYEGKPFVDDEPRAPVVSAIPTLSSPVDVADAVTRGTGLVPFSSSITSPALADAFASPVINNLPEFAAHRKTGSQEVIKVSADLLEELVNLAGETSISRGRLEQQVKGFGTAINEIDGTLRRLQEQLRRLDIETEAQILFRQEQLAEHEAFDPLEMDRYSQLQQLSRSLTESASDLVDLKRTLSEKVKDTEAILLHQSRVNSSLQEGLMRSRMVPFSRLVPRLRRIVRQVAAELGKHVSFELDNVEGEMDRTVLERMVAPLEHMLRNAVDHGIEMPNDRLAQGKPEAGRILLSLAREGSDILLRLADDGRGISLEKVRKKAVERGLMAADSVLSDHEVMQFILQAGFSTAENITQISGRGVGMDVVAAEIKQLGGSMTIESRSGVGSQFTVRLPFTVSVNRALMVTLGQDTFAIPLNSIEGIVRVSPFELEHYYQESEARFEYADENYQVRYLGSMLYEDASPKLEGQLLPLPVILVRSAQHTMALQVDSLSGSREIVVKSLGKQFAAVQGLSGATVMGDGSVVVILDVHALVRKAVAFANPMPLTYDRNKSLNPPRVAKTVMVVDDSVTVRKVTTRFLEREGFTVITAKDGVDALKILQDTLPDLMLLDIEMPRMDGFEVAKNVRTTARWKHLPIIMITSRTGDKHREHALSIGVNDYLGKPYQEDVLLGIITKTLAAKKA